MTDPTPARLSEMIAHALETPPPVPAVSPWDKLYDAYLEVKGTLPSEYTEVGDLQESLHKCRGFLDDLGVVIMGLEEHLA